MKTFKVLLVPLFIAVFMSASYSASAETGETDLSLSEVLDLKITVFGNGAVSNRKAPAITSVITREEIMNTGATDLQEALDILVPGYVLTANTTSPVLSVRGIESIFGKILLMYDGLELQDEAWQQLFWAYHFNLDNVKQIEIIRGPGSAVYGGVAELTVINVITRDGSQNAAYAMATATQMSKIYGQRSVTAGLGKKVGDFSTSVTFTSQAANQTQLPAFDVGSNKWYRRTVNNLDQMNLHYFNWNVAYKGLSFRTYTNLWTEKTIFTGPVLADPSYYNIPADFYYFQNINELKYDLALSRSFRIVPKVVYKKDLPLGEEITYGKAYGCTGVPLCSIGQNFVTTTTKGEIAAHWDVSDNFQFVGGVEAERATTVNEPPLISYTGAKFNPAPLPLAHPTITRHALFSQATWYTSLVNVAAGARYEGSSFFSPALVPRLGLTRTFDRFNIKLLASQSYRSPSVRAIEQSDPKKPLKPEISTSYEIELGYQFSQNVWAALNFFDLSVRRVIQVGAAQSTSNGVTSYYTNSGSERTRGLEGQLKYNSKYLDVNGNYAYYAAFGQNTVAKIAAHPDSLSGAPNHKANLIFTGKPFRKFAIVPWVQYWGTRYYQLPSSSGAIEVKKMNPDTYLNLNIRFLDLFTPGLDFSLGAKDIIDRGMYFAENTFSGTAPMPGPSRRFTTQLSYTRTL